MEERLKEDIIKEIYLFNGKIMLHDEISDKQVIKWQLFKKYLLKIVITILGKYSK